MLTFLAVSQGVIAQARVLGGSIGIAASSAILGATTRSQLTGLVTPAQLSSLQASAKTLTEEQLHAIRQAYSDSFSEGMKVCAAVAAVCAVATLMTYRRNVPDVAARREEQLMFDNELRRKEKESNGNSRDIT